MNDFIIQYKTQDYIAGHDIRMGDFVSVLDNGTVVNVDYEQCDGVALHRAQTGESVSVLVQTLTKAVTVEGVVVK